MREHTFNATPLPVYPFKMVIPIAGTIVLLQGIAEIVRCVVCLRTGEWPSRLHDVAETDVIEEQTRAVWRRAISASRTTSRSTSTSRC